MQILKNSSVAILYCKMRKAKEVISDPFQQKLSYTTSLIAEIMLLLFWLLPHNRCGKARGLPLKCAWNAVEIMPQSCSLLIWTLILTQIMNSPAWAWMCLWLAQKFWWCVWPSLWSPGLVLTWTHCRNFSAFPQTDLISMDISQQSVCPNLSPPTLLLAGTMGQSWATKHTWGIHMVCSIQTVGRHQPVQLLHNSAFMG